MRVENARRCEHDAGIASGSGETETGVIAALGLRLLLAVEVYYFMFFRGGPGRVNPLDHPLNPLCTWQVGQ
jgi:hypothetical protein